MPMSVVESPSVVAAAGWGEQAPWRDRAILAVFVGVPFLAVAAAVPLVWGWGVTATDICITAVMYVLTTHGISIGYHRLFTHMAFKARPWLRVVLACLGTMAIEGDVITWVADHRRHHHFSDRPGDPHSPWRFGTSPAAVARGMIWAHFWWMFCNETTNKQKYAPDLLADTAIRRVVRAQPLLVLLSFAAPATAALVITGTWHGAVTALFWAGLVRVGLLHHIT